MIAYADTGFLISLYGRDANSARAILQMDRRPPLLLTPFGEAEFANAVELIVFRGDWTRAQASIVKERLRAHQSAGVFRSAPLPDATWNKAIELSVKHSANIGARTLDVLHVASALLLEADLFFSFDERQRKLARAEGFKVQPI